MKNLLLLVVIVFGASYFYTHPRVETRLEPVAAREPVVQPPSPPPPPPQKVYYHSPLDASAMSTSEHTGMGYFSVDPNSRFSGYQSQYPTYGAVAGGYPVYVGGGGTTNNTVIINNRGSANTASAPVPRPPSHVAGPFTTTPRNAQRGSQPTTY